MDMQKVVYTYNVISFSLKRKEILTYATTWMNPENIMLSEISQTQKDKYSIDVCKVTHLAFSQNKERKLDFT